MLTFFFVKGQLRRIKGISLCVLMPGGVGSDRGLNRVLNKVLIIPQSMWFLFKILISKNHFFFKNRRKRSAFFISEFGILFFPLWCFGDFPFLFYVQPGLSTGQRYFSFDTSTTHFSYQKLPLFFSYQSLSRSCAFAHTTFHLPTPFLCFLRFATSKLCTFPEWWNSIHSSNFVRMSSPAQSLQCSLPIFLTPGRINHSLLHPPRVF